MKIPAVSLYGVHISRLNMADTVKLLTEAIVRRQPHQVVTINPIMLMAGLNDPSYMAMLRRAELIVPDGAGVVWAAGYIGCPVAERVPGIELAQRLLEVGDQYGWKVYLLGTSPDTIRMAADNLWRRYPNIQWVGVRDGFFGEDQDEQVVADIVRAAPDILLVGRSASGQEPWIDRFKTRLNVPVMMGVGGSFDVIAGKLKRAPAVMQKMRLEWLFRLLQEPKRFPRMLALPKFVVKVVREKEKLRKQANAE